MSADDAIADLEAQFAIETDLDAYERVRKLGDRFGFDPQDVPLHDPVPMASLYVQGYIADQEAETAERDRRAQLLVAERARRTRLLIALIAAVATVAAAYIGVERYRAGQPDTDGATELTVDGGSGAGEGTRIPEGQDSTAGAAVQVAAATTVPPQELPLGAPVGATDSITSEGNLVATSGWAVDPDAPGSPIPIEVEVFGCGCRAGTVAAATGEPRDDVAKRYAVGPSTGFSMVIDTTSVGAVRRVEVYAVDVAGQVGHRTLIGSWG